MQQPPFDLSVRVGVDLVAVGRLERLLTENPGADAELFTEGELAYCSRKRRRFDHLAARFAAKEAILKAFGTGLSSRMAWKEVEIFKNELGRPRVLLHGGVAAFAERSGITDIDVSFSHAAGLAIAQAISIRRSPAGA